MASAVSAQTPGIEESESVSRFSIGLLGGIATGNLDLNSGYSGLYGGNIRYSINPTVSLQTNVLVGELVSDDVICDLFDPSFKNKYINANLQAHVNIYSLLSKRNAPGAFKIYSILGAGLFKSDVTTEVENPKPGWEEFAGEDNTDNSLYYQLGLGTRIRLSRRIDLFTQFEYGFVSNDRVDGFENSLLEGTDLDNDRNDHFINLTAGLQIKFGSTKRKHADWHWNVPPPPTAFAGEEPVDDAYKDRIQELEEELKEQESTIEELYSTLSQLQDVTSVEQVENGVLVTFKNNVLFDFDSSTLKPNAILSLNHLADEVSDEEAIRLTIVGHTCNIGTEEYNQQLSEERASSVASFLVSEGFDANRINSLGEGESNPKFSNDTEEGRAMNRRVEILIEE